MVSFIETGALTFRIKMARLYDRRTVVLLQLLLICDLII